MTVTERFATSRYYCLMPVHARLGLTLTFLRQNAAQRMKKHDVGENLIAILSHMVSAAYDSDARSD